MPRDTLSLLWNATEPVKRGFLYALIGSVSVGASMAIFAIVFELYWWGDRAVVSALTLVAASGCWTACGVYLKSARERALPLLGVALAPVAAAAVLLTIWVESDSDEILWKTTVTLCVFAVAVAHLCLLFTARLAARFQWAFAVAYVVSFFLTAHLTLIIWFDAGLSIFLVWAATLDGAITTVIPIFHRLSRSDCALPRPESANWTNNTGRPLYTQQSKWLHWLLTDRDTLGALRSAVEPVKRGPFIWSVGVSAFVALVYVDPVAAAMSAATIAAGSGCGLACKAACARNRVSSLMGRALATAAVVATLLSLLAEARLWWIPVLGRTAMGLWVLAVAAAHLCLLSRAKLATGFQWALGVAYVVIPFLSALLTVIIWCEIVNLRMFEVLAVTAVLYATITIMILIFQRLSRRQEAGVDVDTRVGARRAP